MSFHHGKLDSSKRMQRLYKLLKSRRQMSSLAIGRALKSVCPSTDVSALRHNLRAKPRDGFCNIMRTRSNGLHWYWLSKT